MSADLRSLRMIRLAYLSAYNLYGLLGWTFILFTLAKMLAEGRVTDLWKVRRRGRFQAFPPRFRDLGVEERHAAA
jgi:hypothetical protein